MRKLIGTLVLLLAVQAGFGGLARADSAPMSTVGPHLQPMESTTVRLESERIDIHLRRATARDPLYFPFRGVADYRILFHFVPSADETMTLGFPLFVVDSDQHLYGARLQDFKVMQGGREVAAETQNGRYKGSDTQWAIFRLDFRKGEPLDLVITYSLPADPQGKTWAADLWIAYVLRTGALWAGTIGKAEAYLTMDRPIRPEDIRGTRPDNRLGTTPGWKLEGGALRWEWRDVEPDFDLSLQVANLYWLDFPAELQALVAKGAPDRETLQRITLGTTSLVEGNGRTGHWEPVRGGLSGDAAEKFLPDVLRLLTDFIRKNPADWEMRELYLRLLYHSSWRQTDQGLVLYNESRFRSHLAEYRQLRKENPALRVVLWLPWTYGIVCEATLSDAAQAEVVALLLADQMPPSFPTEAGAREWAAKAAGGAAKPVLSARNAEALTSEALKRVRPPEPSSVPAPTPAPAPAAPEPAAVAPEPAPSPVSSPARSFPWGPAAAGGALALAFGGALLWRRHAKRP